jgi:hypothetical protein
VGGGCGGVGGCGGGCAVVCVVVRLRVWAGACVRAWAGVGGCGWVWVDVGDRARACVGVRGSVWGCGTPSGAFRDAPKQGATFLRTPSQARKIRKQVVCGGPRAVAKRRSELPLPLPRAQGTRNAVYPALPTLGSDEVQLLGVFVVVVVF